MASETWIKFAAVAAEETSGKRAAEQDDRFLPMVIQYDEHVGAPVDAQETRTGIGNRYCKRNLF